MGIFKINDYSGVPLEIKVKQLDDLKGITTTEKSQLAQKLMRSVEEDNRMQVISPRRYSKRKLTLPDKTNLKNDVENMYLGPDETYKYQEVKEGNGLDNKTMKEKLRKEFCRRIKKILDTELCAKNKIKSNRS